MAKLTKNLVESVKPDAKRDVFVWDSQLPGFGLRVYYPLSTKPESPLCADLGGDIKWASTTGPSRQRVAATSRPSVRRFFDVLIVIDWRPIMLPPITG